MIKKFFIYVLFIVVFSVAFVLIGSEIITRLYMNETGASTMKEIGDDDIVHGIFLLLGLGVELILGLVAGIVTARIITKRSYKYDDKNT